MNKIIYTSEFKTGPEATKKQQMLFATDTKYAFSEGYLYIKSSDGCIFAIMDEHNLVEMHYSEEQIVAAVKNTFEEPDEVEFDPEVKPTNYEEAFKHNLFLIQSVINNTLTQTDDINSETAETLQILANTSLILIEGDSKLC